jgi:predicted membrane-bound spermidine synthase
MIELQFTKILFYHPNKIRVKKIGRMLKTAPSYYFIPTVICIIEVNLKN